MIGIMQNCPPPVANEDDADSFEFLRVDDTQPLKATRIFVDNPADVTDGLTRCAS